MTDRKNLPASARVPARALEAFIKRALLAARLPDAGAARVAELMTRADLIGADNHGVFRLPQYVERIHKGGMNVNPSIRVVRESAGMTLVDGDNGMGHLVMDFATRAAMDKAAHSGVAWVGVRNSNHAGPAALYAAMPLERDMIGLYIAVGNANHMAPWGGTELLLSTNPIAVAVPALEEPPIVLDMATSVAAYGKVKGAAQRGETMPTDWMIDRQGRPLTDPQRAGEGSLLPIGGPKGYGLALVFSLLAGVLNGAAVGRDTIDFNADQVSPTNTGHLIVAISIAAFADVTGFKRSVDRVIRDLHASPTLPGVVAVRVPGERSHRIRVEREREGVPLHGALIARLDALAESLGVAGVLAAS
ncbi:MAG: Ldh family oxidoreductase [Betaproteobacteria bacterium]|jgi:LDH2 family malate/lactate/ureidoglycolate dehydrogenase|nr:Ldh family oxidoreductase [Betaproteobacteria bacterium]